MKKKYMTWGKRLIAFLLSIFTVFASTPAMVFAASADLSQISGAENDVNISENGQTVEISLANEMIKGKFILHKVDKADSNVVLKGVTIVVEDLNGNIIAEKQTDDLGNAEFILPYGKYVWYEKETLKGYILDDTRHDIEISENGQVIQITLENEKVPDVPSIPKTGDDSKTNLWLAGALTSLLGIVGLSSYMVYTKRKSRRNK